MFGTSAAPGVPSLCRAKIWHTLHPYRFFPRLRATVPNRPWLLLLVRCGRGQVVMKNKRHGLACDIWCVLFA